jgi:hypothetical protein
MHTQGLAIFKQAYFQGIQLKCLIAIRQNQRPDAQDTMVCYEVGYEVVGQDSSWAICPRYTHTTACALSSIHSPHPNTMCTIAMFGACGLHARD